MLKSERIAGAAYLPIHIFLLPLILGYTGLLARMNIELSDAAVNLVYYMISFVFILIFMLRYLKASFSDMLSKPLNALKAVILAYFMNYFLVMGVSFLLAFLLPDAMNPNTREIIRQTKLDTNVTAFVAVLLAPIVEESLFRGVLFGTIRGKSRTAAYVISALVFAVYHLWQYFVIGLDWTVLVYLLQYIPASVALCWCYEKSGTIWASIVLHAAINVISISITFG